MSTLSRPRRRPALWLPVLLGLAVIIAGVIYWRAKPPSPAALLQRAAAARADITSIAFTLSTPWPQAQPPASALPGARDLLGPSEGDRTWRVLWRRDGYMRAELLSPVANAGTLTIVTPETTWVYSPLLKIAVSSSDSGPPVLWVDQVLAMVEPAIAQAQLATVTRPTDDSYRVDAPYLTSGGSAATLSVWFDRVTDLPVRTDLVDGNGRMLGTISVSAVDLSPAAGSDDFAFAPPHGARVIDLGSMQSLPDPAAAAVASPVPVLEPQYLPEGFVLGAVNLFGTGEDATLVLTYHRPSARGDGEGAVFSLSTVAAGAGYSALPFGTPARVGTAEGRAFELGSLRGLDWRRGALGFTLFGTLSATELMRIALSVP